MPGTPNLLPNRQYDHYNLHPYSHAYHVNISLSNPVFTSTYELYYRFLLYTGSPKQKAESSLIKGKAPLSTTSHMVFTVTHIHPDVASLFQSYPSAGKTFSPSCSLQKSTTSSSASMQTSSCLPTKQVSTANSTTPVHSTAPLSTSQARVDSTSTALITLTLRRS
jgi:hypothetical protein